MGSQIWWTWETEDVFRRVREGNKHGMKDFAAKLTGQLSELTNMVRGVCVRGVSSAYRLGFVAYPVRLALACARAAILQCLKSC